jgi:hypothetical protein
MVQLHRRPPSKYMAFLILPVEGEVYQVHVWICYLGKIRVGEKTDILLKIPISVYGFW